MSSLLVKLMLAIRRVLNSCIQTDCDQSEINDNNKENSAVRERDTEVDKTSLEFGLFFKKKVLNYFNFFVVDSTN